MAAAQIIALAAKNKLMQITLPSSSYNIHMLMTKAGYHAHPQGESYVMRLGNSNFPRFHVYFKQDQSGKTTLNLHLDQTQTAAKWSAKIHRSEYDSDVTKAEAERLIRWINYYAPHQ